MKRKKLLSGVLATAMVMGATLSGCSLISTNSEGNMQLPVAEVNITSTDDFETLSEGLSTYSGAISTQTILKRDLIAYFLSTGYSYVSQGYTYSTVFTMLIETLTETELLAQYSTLYLLKYIDEEDDTKNSAQILNEYNACETQSAKYEYLLNAVSSINTDSVDRVLLAKYDLYSSINSSIDSYEELLLEEEDEETTGDDSRTTPTGVDTEVEDYYPVTDSGELDYGIYTGYTGYLLSDSGAYADDKLEGSTQATRASAYNSLVKSLKSNYLISEGEDVTDILSLSYIEDEWVNELKTQVIEAFYEVYEQDLENTITSDTSYLESRYQELLKEQTSSYSTVSSFETAMSGLSDDSFVLYAPSTDGTEGGTFGFVYNILLPFSQSQSLTLSDLSNRLEAGTIKENYYYSERNKLLKNITTTDQRSAWFNGTEDYSFDASETSLAGTYYTGGDSSRNYLFFEDNLLNTDRYESLEKYTGLYTYNGTVTEADDGTYILKANTLTIDDMLEEFVAYVNFVLDGSYASYTTTSDYYATDNFYSADDPDEIDYEKFIYAEGTIDFSSAASTFSMSDLLNENTMQYKAMCAVNELQYAYTTDTSVLSEYVGYSVSAYDTSYIEEFETAAQKAINQGVGTFIVCAGDYGWHIIYVTAVYDTAGGNVYNVDWSRKDTKGTFENLFYEYIKENDLSNASTACRAEIISRFSNDNSIYLIEDNYADLMGLDD